MQFELPTAISFVRKHGTLVEHARLAYLLEHVSPNSAVAASVFANQQPDGGWLPFWASNYSSLDATCYRLAQAEPFGSLFTSSAGQRALDFLIHRQLPDGSWQEQPPADLMLPPWLTPNAPATIGYLTANCGFWLSLYSPAMDHAQRAASYLASQIPHTQLIATPHTAWLTAALWYACGQCAQADQVLGQLVAHHQSLSASMLTWAMTSLTLAQLPVDHWFMARGASQLAALQRPDGGWESDDGVEREVHVTLEAIRLFGMRLA